MYFCEKSFVGDAIESFGEICVDPFPWESQIPPPSLDLRYRKKLSATRSSLSESMLAIAKEALFIFWCYGCITYNFFKYWCQANQSVVIGWLLTTLLNSAVTCAFFHCEGITSSPMLLSNSIVSIGANASANFFTNSGIYAIWACGFTKCWAISDV